MSDARATATWRHNRWSHADFIAAQLRAGRKVSPLFTAPGVTTKVFRRDWLHAVDQGVAADALGNLFKEFVSLMPGGSRKDRVAALHARIINWYNQHPDVKDKIIGLRWGGIQQKKASPKLKSSAACARALIPFADEAAQALLDPNDVRHQAMRSLAHHLHLCAQCLSHDKHDWKEVLLDSSAKFAQQFEALDEISAARDWVVKPKMHQFLELCAEGSKPNLCWTYRDEDYGGSMAQLCRMRARWHRAYTYSYKFLALFRMQNPVPRIL